MDAWQEDNLKALLTAVDENVFFAHIIATSKKMGFEYCAFGIRIPLPVTNPKIYVFHNYSEEWWDQYTKNNYLLSDPTVRHGLTSSAPIIWTPETFSSAPEMWENANAHGLNHGWSQSARDITGAVGMLSLSRGAQKLCDHELSANESKMRHLVQITQAGMTKFLLPKLLPESFSHITPREKEVLRWTADGKTSYEIGQILDISVNAVNFHVNNVVAKLGASNKTHAVAKAAMVGLLG